MNKKLKLSIMAVGVIALFLMSFFNAPAIASPAKVEKASTLPAVINLCGVFPISARPDAGPDRRDGFLIAVDEINAQTGADRILPDGVTFKAFPKDDLNTAEGGTAAANACVSDGAHLVIGSSGSTVSAAMAAVFTPLELIQISYASSSPSLSDRTEYPYFMRNVASDADQGLAVADLVKEMGFSTGATINTDDTYGTGLVSHFVARFEGTLLTAQTFAPGATDVSSEVQAISDKNPEFVLLHAIDNDAKTVFKKAFELGIAGGSSNIVWIITDGSSTTATFAGDDDVKTAMEKAIGTNPAQAGSSKNAEFETAWDTVSTCAGQNPCGKSRTNAAPNSYTRFAYDAVYIAAEGLAASPDLSDSTALLTALYAVSFVGAGGNIAFNSLGEVNGRFDYVQLVDGEFTTFGTWAGSSSFDDDTITLANGQTATFGEEFVPGGAGAPGFELLVAILGFSVIVVIRKRK